MDKQLTATEKFSWLLISLLPELSIIVYLKLKMQDEIFSNVITGLIIFVVVGLWQANWILGGIIGVSMFFAITVATIAGSLIPLLIDSMGFDPSFASGLFITTVSDLTSVFVYFTIASMFLEKFLGN